MISIRKTNEWSQKKNQCKLNWEASTQYLNEK